MGQGFRTTCWKDFPFSTELPLHLGQFPLLCPMSESPSGKREGFQDNATRKKGKFVTDSSQGFLPQPSQWCRVRKPRAEAVTQVSGMHKRLVAGLSRLVTCLQSNFIGTNFRWLLFKLRHPRAFQLSLCFLLGAYWLAGSRLPDGGRESHHFRGNRNPGLGCLPAPAAPHHVST